MLYNFFKSKYFNMFVKKVSRMLVKFIKVSVFLIIIPIIAYLLYLYLFQLEFIYE